MKHHCRKTPQQEIRETTRIKAENIANAEKFLHEIKDIQYDFPLPDTCFIIRKNDDSTNNLFEQVYNLLREKGLRRDQNVYNHAIYKNNYPLNDLYMLNDLTPYKM